MDLIKEFNDLVMAVVDILNSGNEGAIAQYPIIGIALRNGDAWGYVATTRDCFPIIIGGRMVMLAPTAGGTEDTIKFTVYGKMTVTESTLFIQSGSRNESHIIKIPKSLARIIKNLAKKPA